MQAAEKAKFKIQSLPIVKVKHKKTMFYLIKVEKKKKRMKHLPPGWVGKFHASL